jgi:DNA polymerase/3'-5' exonuclease PolX
VKNKEIAKILYDMGELLELKGENRFKIIAYGKAARAIESLKDDIEQVCNSRSRQGNCSKSRGIYQNEEDIGL